MKPTMPDDAELLLRYARDGSAEAFEELVRRHVGLVYAAAARRLGVQYHAAEDVAQQVFIALARKPPRLARGSSLAGWLYGATRHKALDWIRAEGRRRLRETTAMTDPSRQPEPEADWEQIRPEIDAAMDRLPRRDQEALVLRFFDGQTHAEVAAALRLPEHASRKRIERALGRLRLELGRRGVTSTAAALAGALAEQSSVSAAPAGLASKMASSALATSGAQAATGLGLAQLMATTKTAVSMGGAALLVLAVGATTRELILSQQDRTALAAARQSYDAAAERLEWTQKHGDAAAAGRNARHAPPPEIQTPPANDNPIVIKTPRFDPQKARAAAQALEAAHPEVKDAYAKMAKARVAADYQSFFSVRNLTPDQIDQLEEIMVDSHGVGMAMVNSGPMGQYAYQFTNSDHPLSPAERDAQLRQLLGPGGFQQLQEFNRTSSARSFAGLVVQEALDAGQPLTPAQTAQLTEVVAASSPSYAAGGKVTADDIDWERVQQQARGMLPGSQADAVGAAVQQVQFNQAWTQALPSKP